MPVECKNVLNQLCLVKCVWSHANILVEGVFPCTDARRRGPISGEVGHSHRAPRLQWTWTNNLFPVIWIFLSRIVLKFINASLPHLLVKVTWENAIPKHGSEDNPSFLLLGQAFANFLLISPLQFSLTLFVSSVAESPRDAIAYDRSQNPKQQQHCYSNVTCFNAWGAVTSLVIVLALFITRLIGIEKLLVWVSQVSSNVWLKMFEIFYSRVRILSSMDRVLHEHNCKNEGE